MISRYELAAFLDDYLACSSYSDYAPNGLQIEGRATVKRICTAVTASRDIILQAVELQADALFVHHGYFWRGEDPVLTGIKRQRVEQLLRHDMNLFAYHLPLDCHLTLGNNACIGQLLKIQQMSSHAVGKTSNLLWSGVLQEPMTAELFYNELAAVFKQKPLQISGSKKPIYHVAWCSGAAQDYIVDAHRLGADAYISGEISERTYYEALELGIDYFACGHHATERYGIQALGELLSNQFGVVHHFLDSDNPV